MSLTSDAWNDMSPAVRDFYRNHSLTYMHFCRPYFNGTLYYWHLDVGIDLLRWNFSWQMWLYGHFRPDFVLLFEGMEETFLPWGFPMSDLGFITSFNQWKSVPTYSDEYPRPKYNARRSYWTGAPRKRMNL